METFSIFSFVLLSILITFTLSYAFAQNQTAYPNWISIVNKSWSQNQISDQEFVNVYNYLIDKKILAIYDIDHAKDMSFEKQLELTKHIASYFDINTDKPTSTGINASNSDHFISIKNRFIYIESLPSYYTYSNNTISDAVDYWMKSDNVKFNLVSDSSGSVITVRWLKEIDLPESGYTIGNKIIEIGLGDSKCGGMWHPYNQSFVSEVLRHELGHALDHKHSTNPLDVMYPIINDKKYIPLVNTTNSQQGC